MIPRWKAYRSAKWFELAMYDAAANIKQSNGCPFCRQAGKRWSFFHRSEIHKCEACIWGPKRTGCVLDDEFYVTCTSIWGEEAWP